MKNLLNRIWFKSFFRKPKDEPIDIMSVLKKAIKKRQKTLSARKVVINDGGRIENMDYQFKNGEYVVTAWFFASYDVFKIAYVYDSSSDKVFVLFLNTSTKDVVQYEPYQMASDFEHMTNALGVAVRLTATNTPEIKEYLSHLDRYGELKD